MDRSVVRTRIIVPHRRTDFFSRRRLTSFINDLLDKKLILISAPAGYGKTGMLIDFASQTKLPVCWYSIDSLDVEPRRFLETFISAIQVVFPKFGLRSLSVLASTTQAALDVNYLATVIINELFETVTEHFVIVLDDYHLVNENETIGSFFSRFIEDVDENCHAVLTSRNLLTLPCLPTMVARGEVGGLSYEELAFSIDEIRELFSFIQNKDLSFSAAERLMDQTEGWITGILITSQVNPQGAANQNRVTRVSGVGLEDYFLQVLNHQPGAIREFLLRTSLLGEFDANRCEEVIGTALQLEGVDWNELIDQVMRNNLFVLPVGEDGSWLRYHHLFLDFLQMRVFRERAAEAGKIERYLAGLYLQAGEWDSAYMIYRRLGMTAELLDLIEMAGSELIGNGRITTLAGWLDALPLDVISTRPSLVSLQGSVAVMNGNTALALAFYDQAIAAMRVPADRAWLARALERRANTLRMTGNLTAAVRDAQDTLELVENDLSMRNTKADAMRILGICSYQQGKLHEALDWLTQSLYTHQTIKNRKTEAAVRLEIGLVHEALGNYNLARDMYQAALDYWTQTNNSVWLSNLYNNLGVLQHLMGDYEAALGSLENALRHARITGYFRIEAYALTGVGDIYTELGAAEEAQQAYERSMLIAQRINERFLQVYTTVQQASLCAIRGDYVSGYRLIDDARAMAAVDNSPLEVYLCDLAFADLAIQKGNPAAAIPALEKASLFFENEGHKIQKEKAHLFLALAYARTNRKEKLLEQLLKLLAYVKAQDTSSSFIAAATRFRAGLEGLRKVEFVGSQLDDLFVRIDKQSADVPALRRSLRQYAVSVPFSPPTLYIRALGRMHVSLNNRLITSSDWQTQSARDLLFLLLAHPEGLTKEEIAVFFWPDDSPEEVKFRFKNTVYRLRHALGKNAVLLENESYRFNYALDYEYDVELFLHENALAQQAKTQEERLSHYHQAAKLYKGRYLPDMEETWVLTPRECLQQIFLNILLQGAEQYLEQHQYESALDFCQLALEEDNCLEAAYRLILRIYAAMGNRAGLVRQYQRCCEVLEREINATPSPQTQALYQNLLR